MKKNETKKAPKFQVKSISIGQGNGGRGCDGWCPGPEINEIKVHDAQGEEYYLSLAYVDGCPNYFKTKKSTFLSQVQEIDDEKFWEELNENDIASGCNYREAFENDDPEVQRLMPLLEFLAGLNNPEKYSIEIPDVTVTTKVVYYYDNEKERRTRGTYEKLLENSRYHHEDRIKYIDSEIHYKFSILTSSVVEFDDEEKKEILNEILRLMERKQEYIATNAKLTKQPPEPKGKNP